jgi:hypothetical protein
VETFARPDVALKTKLSLLGGRGIRPLGNPHWRKFSDGLNCHYRPGELSGRDPGGSTSFRVPRYSPEGNPIQLPCTCP